MLKIKKIKFLGNAPPINEVSGNYEFDNVEQVKGANQGGNFQLIIENTTSPLVDITDTQTQVE